MSKNKNLNDSLLEDAATVIATIQDVVTWSLVLLMTTSPIAVCELVDSYIQDFNWSMWAVVPIKIASVLITTKFLDVGLRTFMGYGAVELISLKFWPPSKRTIVFLLVWVIIVFQLNGTFSLSEMSKSTAVDMVFNDSLKFDTEEIEMKLNKENSNEIALVQNIVDDLENRTEEIEKDAGKHVFNALMSKGSEMKRLYDEGNGWAAEQLEEAYNKGVQDSINQVSEHIALISLNQHTISEKLAIQTVHKTNTLADKTKSNNDHDNKKDSSNNTFSLFIIIAVVLFVTGKFILAVVFVHDDKTQKTNKAYDRIMVDPIMDKITGFIYAPFSYITFFDRYKYKRKRFLDYSPTPSGNQNPNPSIPGNRKKNDVFISDYLSKLLVDSNPDEVLLTDTNISLLLTDTPDGNADRNADRRQKLDNQSSVELSVKPSVKKKKSVKPSVKKRKSVKIDATIVEYNPDGTLSEDWFEKFKKKVRGYREISKLHELQEARDINAEYLQKGIKLLNDLGYGVLFGSKRRKEIPSIEDNNQIGLTFDKYNPELVYS